MLLLRAQNAFERERWMAHKTLGLLLTAQRALKREEYGLTRFLASMRKHANMQICRAPAALY